MITANTYIYIHMFDYSMFFLRYLFYEYRYIIVYDYVYIYIYIYVYTFTLDVFVDLWNCGTQRLNSYSMFHDRELRPFTGGGVCRKACFHQTNQRFFGCCDDPIVQQIF